MSLTRLIFKTLMGTRRPIYQGRLGSDALSAPVVIRRDAWGIPYIRAENDRDAWYALGFCQGQDRAFQIESRLRVVRGTLAELIGSSALAIDRLSRSIGFYRSAQRQLEALDPQVRALLDAFARGVTDGATKGVRKKAHEFSLLRARPTPYTAADVLGLLKLMSFLLASNWDSELARLGISRKDGFDALKAIDPLISTAPLPNAAASPPAADQKDARTSSQSPDFLARLSEDLQAFIAFTGRGGASNNWALGPDRTRSGRPIVANDPHLSPDLPPHWYLAHIATPGWRVAGAALAGAPGIIVGHNGRVAWGVTAGLTDNTDLFLEEIGEDGASVRRGERFVPCHVETETIHVRGSESVTLRCLETDLGPVLSQAQAGDWAVAMRATWLDPLPITGFLKAHLAASGKELRQLFREWPTLPLNLVYADDGGHIGWQLVGLAPVRKKGHGTFPLPGADAEAGWEKDGVPFEEMPHLANPPEGIIVTANSAPDVDGPYLGSDWLDPYRKRRIVERLAAREKWTASENAALQLDVASVVWEEVAPILRSIDVSDPDAAFALEMLRAWDGCMSADSPAATVFETFLVLMDRRAVRRKVNQAFDEAVGRGAFPLATYTTFGARVAGRISRLMRERPDGWFDGPWEREIELCLAEVIDTLRARFGPGPESWAWGKVRPLVLAHPAGQGVLGRIFNRGPFPIGGDTNTVAQAGVDALDPFGGVLAIASLRAVVEVGSWDEARFVLPGGQSGNPCSPHYDDMLALWLKGESVVLPWSDEAVAKVVRTTLQLQPASAPGI